MIEVSGLTSARGFRHVLCRNGTWHPDSFNFIAVKMFMCRPSRCLHNQQSSMQAYRELADLACEYADAVSYPWIKVKLKDIVWEDIKGFYNTLAQLVSDGRKVIPFHKRDLQYMNELAMIWVKVGAFTDDLPSQNTDTAKRIAAIR